MTADKDTESPGKAGKDQRPQTTLDLKATEIFPQGKPADRAEPKTALPPGGASAPNPASAAKPAAAPPASEAPPPPPQPELRGADMGSFLTHMAAGLMGAALALVVVVLTRDSIPILGGDPSRVESLDRGLQSAQQRIAALEQAGRTATSDAGLGSRLGAVSDQANALKGEVAALAGRMQALETRPAPAAAAAPAAADIETSLEPLNAKVSDLDARLSAVDGRVATLAKTQEELRSSTGSAALTMAVQNLRRAVEEGRPYAAELRTLSSLARQPLDLAPLEARRDRGLASLARLQNDFDAAARAAIDAALPSGDGSFTGDLLAKARSLVRVRPKGDIPGNGADAVLARAEHRLEVGDLAASIREIEQLTGPAAEAMAPWLAEAKAKAAAEASLASIETKLMTSLDTGDHAKHGG